MCLVARLHACSKALVLRGARPARCASRPVPGEACPARPGKDGGQGERDTGEVRRGRARPGAETPVHARPGLRPAPARGERRTVTTPPLIAHAECATIATYSCGIRMPAPDMPNLVIRSGFTCRAFCQVTGLSRPGNPDKHAHRLPAVPPGVMVVPTAGKTPRQ